MAEAAPTRNIPRLPVKPKPEKQCPHFPKHPSCSNEKHQKTSPKIHFLNIFANFSILNWPPKYIAKIPIFPYVHFPTKNISSTLFTSVQVLLALLFCAYLNRVQKSTSLPGKNFCRTMFWFCLSKCAVLRACTELALGFA